MVAPEPLVAAEPVPALAGALLVPDEARVPVESSAFGVTPSPESRAQRLSA